MTRRRATATFVVVKGNLDNMGEHRRWYDMQVLMQFAADVMGGELRQGNHCAILTLPDSAGDTQLVDDRVIDYVDIQKADSPEEVPAVVTRLKRRMSEAGVPAEAVGVNLIKRHLERMYMRYDSWRSQ